MLSTAWSFRRLCSSLSSRIVCKTSESGLGAAGFVQQVGLPGCGKQVSACASSCPVPRRQSSIRHAHCSIDCQTNRVLWCLHCLLFLQPGDYVALFSTALFPASSGVSACQAKQRACGSNYSTNCSLSPNMVIGQVDWTAIYSWTRWTPNCLQQHMRHSYSTCRCATVMYHSLNRTGLAKL